MAVDIKKWFIYGAIVGLFVSLIAPWLIGLIVNSTGVTGITFSTYNLREQIASIANTGEDIGGLLTTWVGNAITIPGIIITMLGIGAACALVAWLFDLIGLDKSIKPGQKQMWVLVVANLIMGIAIAKMFPSFEVIPMIFMVVTGAVVVYLVNMILKLIGQSKMVPQ